jgi:hypothetical protein
MLFKLEKCIFFIKEVEFLEYVITIEGLRMQEHKIKKILEWPTPTTVKDIQSFHSKCGYYQLFIKLFSQKAKPLMEITQKDKLF